MRIIKHLFFSVLAFFLILFFFPCEASCTPSHGKNVSAVPFVGGFYEFSPPFEEYTLRQTLYGILTTDGEIIEEPIYLSADVLDIDGGNYIIALEEKCFGGEASNRLLTVTASNGTELFSLINGHILSHSDGRIVATAANESGSTAVYMYDYSGRLLGEYQDLESFIGFDGGYLYLYDNLTETSCVVGVGGTIVFRETDLIFPFHCGVTVAESDGSFGVIDIDGNWLIEPKYEKFQAVAGREIYHLSRRGSGVVTDKKGNVIGTYSGSPAPREYYISDGKAVFSLPSGEFFTESGQKIICPESGAAASEINTVSGLFFGETDGTGYVFDLSGNIVVSLRGASGMNAYDFFGDYYCLYIEKATCTVTVIYSHKTNKELYRFVSTDAEGGCTLLEHITPEGTALFSVRNAESGEEFYRLVDLTGGKEITERCRYIEVVTAADKRFFCICTDNGFFVHGGELKPILTLNQK